MTSSKTLSLKERFEEAYPSLTTPQRRIVDALLGDPMLGALWGIEKMAEEARVSVATVMRFSKTFGFEGFSAFREALRKQCRSHNRGNALRLLEAPEDAMGTLAEVARRDAANTRLLFGRVDQALLEAATQRILNARYRLFLGRGVSEVMAEMLAYQLTQAGLPGIVVSPADFATQVGNLGAEDLLMAFSFMPYSRETVDATVFARECGVQVLAFTDAPDSPVALNADCVLQVPCENLLYSHSFTTFALLSHAIATVVASRDRATTIKRLKASDQVSRPLFTKDRNQKIGYFP